MAEVNERVEIYIYPPLNLPWHVTGSILPFTAGATGHISDIERLQIRQWKAALEH
jgi:hypothetical protein